VPSESAAFGEVGLLGEVKRVAREDDRIKEAQRFGFNRVLSGKNQPTVKTAVQKVLD